MSIKGYFIKTFGCQMNEHDSEILAGMLENLGYSKNETRNSSDIIIINTCSIRENADKRFFGTLGELKRVKRENSNTVIAVCGCMMQQPHIIDALKQKYPWVDIIFGTHNIHEFPLLLSKALNEKRKIVDVWDEHEGIFEGLPSKRQLGFKAYVNITYGCNNFCTYCIVPYTRGRERSRKPEDILAEVTELARTGVKEITLLGQNVNSYGKADGFEIDFTDLIYKINEIEGIERIRFMTSHPKDLSDKLIQAYIDCEHLCKHIHLPVQSGSSSILKKMNRKYSCEDYLLLIQKLKKAVPDIAVTTDIIVGFPGETEKDFMETIKLAKTAEFDSVFTFLYSIRKGTPAENFGDQVPEEIKHQRFNQLNDVINQISLIKNKKCEGKIEKVLVEGYSKTNLKTLTGRTESMKILNFKGTPDMIGQIVNVIITEGKTFSLAGETVL